jgi:hypothetical protein
MSLPRLIRSLPQILAVVAAIFFTGAPQAEAGIIQVTDFTAAKGTISVNGGGWQWDQTNRDLGLLSNTSNDYLFQQLSLFNRKDIAGATSLNLTGDWVSVSGNGDFIVRLAYEGTTKASAFFSFGEFTGGQTITKTLSWEPTVAGTDVDQVYIIGNGNSASAAGNILLTNLTVSTGAVPEIDPASANATLAMLFGSLGLIERRSRRLWIARRDSTPATAV